MIDLVLEELLEGIEKSGIEEVIHAQSKVTNLMISTRINAKSEEVLLKLQKALRSPKKSIFAAAIRTFGEEYEEIEPENECDENDINPLYLQAFEKKFGPVEKIKVDDSVRKKIQFKGEVKEDSPVALLARVSKRTFNDPNKKSITRIFLGLMRNGKSVKEAKEICLREELITRMKFNPSKNYLIAFEQAAGQKLEDLSEREVISLTVKIEGDILIQDSFSALVQRVMKKTGSQAKAKLWLYAIRDGKELSEAQKTSETKLLFDGDWSKKRIDELEAFLGKIDDLSVVDTERRPVCIANISYEESPNTLFDKLARKFFKEKELLNAKEYLIARKEGKEHAAAVKVTLAKAEANDARKKNSKEYLLAFEASSGIRIDVLDINDTKPVSVVFMGFTFNDSQQALLTRSKKHFPKSTGYKVIRNSLVACRDNVEFQVNEELLSHEMRRNMDRTYLAKFQEAVGTRLAYTSSKNTTSYTFQVNGVTFTDTPRNVLRRMSKSLFKDDQKIELSKKYLWAYLDGMTPSEALEYALHSDAEEYEFEKLEEVGLIEAIALLQDDPLKLKRYIQFSHEEMSEEEIDRLVTRSFKGLRDGEILSSEDKYSIWEETLPPVFLEFEPPEETPQNTILLKGRAKDCTHVFISGSYTRKKKVEENGEFAIEIPLKTGEKNSLRVMGINLKNQKRSPKEIFELNQTGNPDDTEALIGLLSELGKDARRKIQSDEGKANHLCECLEQMLMKKFGKSFDEGVAYVERLRNKTGTSSLIKKILGAITHKYKKIRTAKIPGVLDDKLLFFQRYCAWEIRRRMNEELPGVILANDPGTGKTRIVQAATADRHTTVITPNSVVSAWEEESGKVLDGTDVLAMRALSHELRKRMLRTRRSLRDALTPQHTYINREFLQKTTDTERFNLLSDSDTILVHDEAHSRTNEKSEQSKGAKMLESQFQILVSATPFKDPKTFRRMMAILKPNDVRFSNDSAFTKAFPPNNPEALKTLSLLKSDVTLRFRKEDVMETVDPNQPLKDQKHKLPIKEFVPPSDLGEFTMNEEQAESIYLMFTDWQKWCQKNGKYIPTDEISKDDHLRTPDGFAKRHALRQTVNNPAYVGSQTPDQKLIEMKNIVSNCLKENRKVVIFCSYEAQAQKYAEAFADLLPCLYTGQTSKKGDVKNAHGKPQRFKKGDTGNHQHGWVLDGQGRPIEDPAGEVMSALDYERITFQNSPNRKLLISTYNAGAVGTTFTAGKALIEDDLPSDCIEEIQAEDRIHRIDPARMTHPCVKYYKLKSLYPDSFLQKVRKRWLVKMNGRYEEFSTATAARKFAEPRGLEVDNAYDLFFEQGTYDEVHEQNLKAQRIMFRLINDGIADESVLSTQEHSFQGLMNGANGNNDN